MAKKKQTRNQRQAEQERKRDDRSARRALQRERKCGEYLDKDDEDFISFSNQLQAIGLKIKDVIGDGNCLFRALGDQLDGDMTNHAQHRRDTVQYIIENRADFEPFMEDDITFDKHVKLLGNDGTFGGNDSIVAFSRRHGVDVIIHQHNAPALHISGGCSDGKASRRVLNLSYHYGEHYSSVRPVGESVAAKSTQPGCQTTGTTGKGHTAATAKKDRTRKPRHAATAAATPGADKEAPEASAAADSVDQDWESLEPWLRDLIVLVAAATACSDQQLIADALRECEYDVDLAIAYVLQLSQATDLSAKHTSAETGMHQAAKVGKKEDSMVTTTTSSRAEVSTSCTTTSSPSPPAASASPSQCNNGVGSASSGAPTLVTSSAGVSSTTTSGSTAAVRTGRMSPTTSAGREVAAAASATTQRIASPAVSDANRSTKQTPSLNVLQGNGAAAAGATAASSGDSSEPASCPDHPGCACNCIVSSTTPSTYSRQEFTAAAGVDLSEDELFAIELQEMLMFDTGDSPKPKSSLPRSNGVTSSKRAAAPAKQDADVKPAAGVESDAPSSTANGDTATTVSTSTPTQVGSAQAIADAIQATKLALSEDALLAEQLQQMECDGLDLSGLGLATAGKMSSTKPAAAASSSSKKGQPVVKVKVGRYTGTRVKKADKKKERKQRRADERKEEARQVAAGGGVAADSLPWPPVDGKGGSGQTTAELGNRPDGVPKLVSI